MSWHLTVMAGPSEKVFLVACVARSVAVCPKPWDLTSLYHLERLVDDYPLVINQWHGQFLIYILMIFFFSRTWGIPWELWYNLSPVCAGDMAFQPQGCPFEHQVPRCGGTSRSSRDPRSFFGGPTVFVWRWGNRRYREVQRFSMFINVYHHFAGWHGWKWC